MTSSLSARAPQLREALYELSMSRHIPNAALLDDVIRRYPAHANELTEFAIKLALDALPGDAATDAAEVALDAAHVSPAVSRAMSKFHNRLFATRGVQSARESTAPREDVSNPFTVLTRDEFRGVALRLGVTTAFVVKLRDRQILAQTIPDRFRRHVADQLKVPLELVSAHFSAPPGEDAIARQFFKADAKPSAAVQQSFEEAVRNSGLTAEQQEQLLSL